MLRPYKAKRGHEPSCVQGAFGDLEAGDCFLDDDDLCIKIEPVKEGREDRNAAVIIGDAWVNGSVLRFADDKMVTPVAPVVNW